MNISDFHYLKREDFDNAPMVECDFRAVASTTLEKSVGRDVFTEDKPQVKPQKVDERIKAAQLKRLELSQELLSKYNEQIAVYERTNNGIAKLNNAIAEFNSARAISQEKNVGDDKVLAELSKISERIANIEENIAEANMSSEERIENTQNRMIAAFKQIKG